MVKYGKCGPKHFEAIGYFLAALPAHSLHTEYNQIISDSTLRDLLTWWTQYEDQQIQDLKQIAAQAVAKLTPKELDALKRTKHIL